MHSKKNADSTLVSVCGIGPRLAMPGLNQGEGSEVRGPHLVTHLAPRVDLKQAGGTPCHWVQQRAQGLSRGCCSADLHSDNSDSASCFVFLVPGYQMRTFFARRCQRVYIFFFFFAPTITASVFGQSRMFLCPTPVSCRGIFFFFVPQTAGLWLEC